MRRALRTALAVLALLTARCGGNANGAADAASDASTIAIDAPDAGTPHDAAPDGAVLNHDFETAVPFLGLPIAVELRTAGERVFYSFHAEPGQWVLIRLVVEPGTLDAMLTLYDPDGTQLARNADTPFLATRNRELVFRAVGSGTYYVVVEDAASVRGEPTTSHAGDVYDLVVLPLSPSSSPMSIEPDPETGEVEPLRAALVSADGYTLGTVAAVDDPDLWRFDVPTISTTSSTEDLHSFFLAVPPCGPDGLGTTCAFVGAEILGATGEVVARASLSVGAHRTSISRAPMLFAWLEAGSYVLRLVHGSIASDVDGYYVLRTWLTGDGTTETRDATNGDALRAEGITLTPDPSSSQRFVDLSTRLQSLDDVDYFATDVNPWETLSVACLGEELGSGVRHLHLEVRNRADEVLPGGAADEQDGDGYVGLGLAPSAESVVLIRISKGAQASDVSSTFVRCSVLAY